MITDEGFGNKDLSRVTARSRMISRVLSEIGKPDVRASDDSRRSPVSPLLARNSASDISIFTKILRAAAAASYIWIEISLARIDPKYPEETVLFPVFTTRQRNFELNVNGIIFIYKYFNFGLNTTGLSQSHFRNLSACSLNGSKTQYSKNDTILKTGRNGLIAKAMIMEN